MRRIPVDLVKTILLAIAFVIGVLVFTAGSAVGQPQSLTDRPTLAVTPGPRQITLSVSPIRAAPAVSVVTTSQVFGY